MKSLDCCNLRIPSNRIMALGVIEPLTEMSSRNPTGGGDRRPVHKADNLGATYEPFASKSWSLDVSQPNGPLRPVEGVHLLFIPAVSVAILAGSSDSKTWPLLSGDSEPGITVLARTSSNFQTENNETKGFKILVYVPVILTSKINHRIHNSPSLIPVLDQVNPVRILPPSLLGVTVLLLSTPRPSN
jgi:hypothetical protein